jgi:hypothetical protein
LRLLACVYRLGINPAQDQTIDNGKRKVDHHRRHRDVTIKMGVLCKYWHFFSHFEDTGVPYHAKKEEIRVDDCDPVSAWPCFVQACTK